MRAALLVSTLAFLAGSPAWAQCVYVACNGGAHGAPAYQQPAYQQPTYQAPAPLPRAAQMPAPGAGSDYDDGYAAGLAARPRAQSGRPPSRAANRPATRAHGATRSRHNKGASAAKHRVAARATAARSHAAPVAKRRAVAVTHAAPARAQAARRVTPARAAPRHVVTTNNNAPRIYQDQIKDRAATYRPAVYGQSTTMASMMSRSGGYTSTTTWSGPASTVRQGGQVCGWGARIVTNNQGYAQRQAVWVCQCPQGWRPPGY